MNKYLNKNKFSVDDRVLQRLKRSKLSVFIPADFVDITSYPQVMRVLKKNVNSGVLIKLGYGVYAKATRNSINGEIAPAIDNVTITLELLKKLKIKWDYSQIVKDYNEGKTTQVPVGRLIQLKQRFSRKLEWINDVYA